MSHEGEAFDGRTYVLPAVFGAVWIWFANLLAPGTIPFETFSFWQMRTPVIDWLKAGVPLFVWGALAQSLVEYLNSIVLSRAGWRGLLFSYQQPKMRDQLATGYLHSYAAGVLEECAFRWLVFLSSIVWLKISNFVLFGFLGFGLARWLHLYIFGPWADWATFGRLHAQLFSPDWAVGAAMLLSNAFFRNGHKYLGLFGLINAWYLGMFFFWVLFAHGLFAAILVHVLYDMVVFTVMALGARARRVR